MKSLIILFLTTVLIISVNACGKKECPDGMHEVKLPDGTTICAPDGL